MSDLLLPYLAVLSARVRAGRRLVCRHHNRVAAASPRQPVVLVLCQRCGRRDMWPLRGPAPVVKPGVVMVDAEAYAMLQAAYRVEHAFAEMRSPW